MHEEAANEFDIVAPCRYGISIDLGMAAVCIKGDMRAVFWRTFVFFNTLVNKRLQYFKQGNSF